MKTSHPLFYPFLIFVFLLMGNFSVLTAQSLFGKMLLSNNSGITIADCVTNSQKETIILTNNNSMINIDSNGILSNSKTFITDSVNSPYHLRNFIHTADNGYLITSVNVITNKHFVIFKTDANFNILWSRRYSRGQDVNANGDIKTIQLKDGSYLIGCAVLRNSPIYLSWPSIIKIDSIGTLMWKKTIYDFGTLSAYFSGIQLYPSADYGFVMAGQYGNFPFIAKIDQNLLVTWLKFYGIAGTVNSVLASAFDDDIIISGSANCSNCGPGGSGVSAPYIMKTSSTGVIKFAKYFGFNEGTISSVNEYPDSTLIAIGNLKNNANGQRAISILKLRADLDTLWTSNFIGNNGYKIYDTGNHFNLTGDCKNFVQGQMTTILELDIVGHAQCNTIGLVRTVQDITNIIGYNFFSTSSSDSLFIDSIANVTSSNFIFNSLDYCNFSSIKDISEQHKVEVFPNPFSTMLTITTNESGASELIIFNVYFTPVLKRTFSDHILINTELLDKGIYLYQVKNKKGVAVGKLVKN